MDRIARPFRHEAPRGPLPRTTLALLIGVTLVSLSLAAVVGLDWLQLPIFIAAMLVWDQLQVRAGRAGGADLESVMEDSTLFVWVFFGLLTLSLATTFARDWSYYPGRTLVSFVLALIPAMIWINLRYERHAAESP